MFIRSTLGNLSKLICLLSRLLLFKTLRKHEFLIVKIVMREQRLWLRGDFHSQEKKKSFYSFLCTLAGISRITTSTISYGTVGDEMRCWLSWADKRRCGKKEAREKKVKWKVTKVINIALLVLVLTREREKRAQETRREEKKSSNSFLPWII